MLPGQLGGVLRLAGQQRPQPRIDTGDVVGGQRRAQHLVDVGEQVVDVGAAGRRVGEVEVPVRVGRPDDPVAAPGDHEQHAALGAQDQPGGGVDPVPGHQQVDALGGPHRQLAAPAGHRLDVVGPHPRGVDGLPGADVDLPAALEVVDPHPGDPVALAQQARHPGAGGDQRTVVGGGPGNEHRVPGVVDLGVPVLDRAHQGVRAQRGDGAQRRPPGQVAMARHRPAGTAEGVVEHHPSADVGAFPSPVGQREQERDRADEVRAERVQQQRPLPQRLTDERDVELFEVAQTAVDQLAGPAGRAGREVARLDQRHGQPTGGRVERDTCAGDAPADDDDVDDVGFHLDQGVTTGGGIQPCRSDHRVPRPRSVAARAGADRSHRACRERGPHGSLLTVIIFIR